MPDCTRKKSAQNACMSSAAASADMHFFSLLARCGSLSAAARELQVSTPAVSKRLALLEPLQTLRLARLYPELYREMLMNVFLFFPLGLAACQLMPETWRPGARAAGALGLGLALSLCVETAQYLWGLGIAETDDVLCNTLGTALGTLSLGTGALFRKGKEDGEK